MFGIKSKIIFFVDSVIVDGNSKNLFYFFAGKQIHKLVVCFLVIIGNRQTVVLFFVSFTTQLRSFVDFDRSTGLDGETRR